MRILFSFLALASFAVAAPIYTPNLGNDFRNDSWSFGQIFTVGAVNVTVSALGAYDAGGDGFITAGGILAGLYRESDQSLLASTAVLSGDPLIDGFRYGAITPLLLLAGETYRVVAVNGDDLYNTDQGYTVNPLVIDGGYGYGQSSTLLFSNQFTGNERVWFSNAFLDTAAVPEPGTALLLAAGVGALALLRRR